MAIEVDRLIVRLVGDTKRYQASMLAAGKETKLFKRKAEGSLGGLSKPMLALGAAAGTMAAFAVKSFAEFDAAMVKSTSIMGDLGAATKREMRSVALSLSGRTIQSAEELANSYYYLASAGKDAQQSMALLPVVARFATAGMFDMAKATDLLTDAQSALGLSSKNAAEDMANMTYLGDLLVKANTLANASVEQFSIALTTKAGAAIKSWNLDLEGSIALLAAYADQGIKAELAGNALDRMFRLLTKSYRENEDAFRRLNIQIYDSAGNFRQPYEIIRDMEGALKGLGTEAKAARLDMLGFEARVAAVLLPLIGTSEKMEEYQRKLEDAAGTTQEVADKQLKSFNNQLKITWNLVKQTATSIGKDLAPSLEGLNKTFQRADRSGILAGRAGMLEKMRKRSTSPLWYKPGVGYGELLRMMDLWESNADRQRGLRGLEDFGGFDIAGDIAKNKDAKRREQAQKEKNKADQTAQEEANRVAAIMEERANREKGIAAMKDRMQTDLATFGMSNRQKAIYMLDKKAETDAETAELKRLDKLLTAREKLRDLKKKAAEESKAAAAKEAQDQEMLVGQAQSLLTRYFDAQRQHQERLKEADERRKANVDTRVLASRAQAQAGTTEFLTRFETFQAGQVKTKTDVDKKIEDNTKRAADALEEIMRGSRGGNVLPASNFDNLGFDAGALA